MDGLAFLTELAKGAPLKGAYYFWGEDPYSLDKAVRAVAATVNPELRDMNVQTLKGPAPCEVEQAAETMPFFAEQRVVIVTEFDADTAAALAAYALKAPDTSVLVFVREGKEPEKNALYAALNREGRAVAFNPLEPEQARRFVEKRAKENGVSIEGSAVTLLVEYLGNDLGALENALLALGAYVGGGTVTRKAVETCVRPSPEYRVFDVLDLLWAGNKRAGIRQLAGMLGDKDESAMGLATLFERNVRTVVAAKQLLLGGADAKAAAKQLGVAPFVAEKAMRGARKRTLEELIETLEAFASIERRQKQGEARAEDALLLACQRYF